MDAGVDDVLANSVDHCGGHRDRIVLSNHLIKHPGDIDYGVLAIGQLRGDIVGQCSRTRDGIADGESRSSPSVLDRVAQLGSCVDVREWRDVLTRSVGRDCPRGLRVVDGGQLGCLVEHGGVRKRCQGLYELADDPREGETE
jgi:hypothetical protein